MMYPCQSGDAQLCVPNQCDPQSLHAQGGLEQGALPFWMECMAQAPVQLQMIQAVWMVQHPTKNQQRLTLCVSSVTCGTGPTCMWRQKDCQLILPIFYMDTFEQSHCATCLSMDMTSTSRLTTPCPTAMGLSTASWEITHLNLKHFVLVCISAPWYVWRLK